MSSDTRVNRNLFMARELAVVHAAWGETADIWVLAMCETRGLDEREPTADERELLWPEGCAITEIKMKSKRCGVIVFPQVRIDVVWVDDPADEDEKECVVKAAIKQVYERMLGKDLDALP